MIFFENHIHDNGYGWGDYVDVTLAIACVTLAACAGCYLTWKIQECMREQGNDDYEPLPALQQYAPV